MPVSATPSIVSGPDGSPVLVDGSRCVPATAAGLTVGTAAIGAAVGAVVGVTLEAAVAIGVAAGATVGVAVGAGVNGGRVPGGMTTGGAALQADVRKWSLISVTSPFRASALPWTVTPFASVMDCRARIVPTKEEPEPRVAELVTCQKTLQGLPPLTKTTELVDAVTRDDWAWKTQTEFGSFWPFSVRVPVKSRTALPELYTPPTRVSPPSAAWLAVTGLLAASRYATVRSDLAWRAMASPA